MYRAGAHTALHLIYRLATGKTCLHSDSHGHTAAKHAHAHARKHTHSHTRTHKQAQE